MTTARQLRSAGLVAVVGAGPSGATLARLLQMRGFRVRVFERDASSTARPQGGSLDLRPDSGQRAISAAGLADAYAHYSREAAKAFRMIDAQGQEMPGIGEETHEDAGPEIDRGDLRQLLLDALEPGTVAWDHLVEDVLPEADGRWRLAIKDKAPVVGRPRHRRRRQRHRSVRAATHGRSRPHLYRHHNGGRLHQARVPARIARVDEVLGEGSVMFAGGGTGRSSCNAARTT